MFKNGSLPAAAIAAAMIGIMTHASSMAQQAQTASIVTFDLFTGDSDELNPDEARKLLDAARQAQAPGDCPLGRITIFMPEGDPVFQEAMGNARRDKVLRFLNANGIEPSRLFVDAIIFGGDGPGNDAQLEFTPSDREPPKLTVTSMPEKGKKVTARQRITVKAIANDNANNWQTGIKSIDLTAEGSGPFGFHDYPPTCDRPPPPRTLEGVYTVPANPPPLVRLRATAKDFAGNETDLLANFPTGDWYGTITKTAKGGGHNHKVTVGFAFDIETGGTIKGRAHAVISTETGEVPGCTMLWTYVPSEFDVPLSGRRNGENFEIALAPPGTTTATIERKSCGEGEPSGTFPSYINPAV